MYSRKEYYALLGFFIVLPLLYVASGVTGILQLGTIHLLIQSLIFLGAIAGLGIAVMSKERAGKKQDENVRWVFGSSLLHLFSVLDIPFVLFAALGSNYSGSIIVILGDILLFFFVYCLWMLAGIVLVLRLSGQVSLWGRIWIWAPASIAFFLLSHNRIRGTWFLRRSLLYFRNSLSTDKIRVAAVSKFLIALPFLSISSNDDKSFKEIASIAEVLSEFEPTKMELLIDRINSFLSERAWSSEFEEIKESHLTFLEKVGIFGSLLGVIGTVVLTDALRSGIDTILQEPTLQFGIFFAAFFLTSIAAMAVLIVHEIWRDSIPYWTLLQYLTDKTEGS